MGAHHGRVEHLHQMRALAHGQQLAFWNAHHDERGFATTSVLTKESAAAKLSWLDGDPETRAEFPEPRLASFEGLLTRCRSESILTSTCEQDIEQLHKEFRISRISTGPIGWSIEKADLPRIIRTAPDATEELMGWPPVARHLDEDDRRRLANAIEKTRACLL